MIFDSFTTTDIAQHGFSRLVNEKLEAGKFIFNITSHGSITARVLCPLENDAISIDKKVKYLCEEILPAIMKFDPDSTDNSDFEDIVLLWLPFYFLGLKQEGIDRTEEQKKFFIQLSETILRFNQNPNNNIEKYPVGKIIIDSIRKLLLIEDSTKLMNDKAANVKEH
jgi:hypothetical protein